MKLETVKLDPQWKGRRQTIRLSLFACLGLSLLAILRDTGDGQLAGAVLPSVSFLATGIIGSYCFGAAWERVAGVPGGNISSAESNSSSASVDEDGKRTTTTKATQERTTIVAPGADNKSGGP